MSQQAVASLIHRLLTDEDLRIRFAADRVGTIADVCLGGLQLSSDEMNVFVTSDPRIWHDDRQTPIRRH
jgi:hypothetical protein